MVRETLSMQGLIGLLEREFERFRATECVMVCRVPSPIFREALAAGDANWYIDKPLVCPRHCHRLIEAVVVRLAGGYDLERPQSDAPGMPAPIGRGACNLP